MGKRTQKDRVMGEGMKQSRFVFSFAVFVASFFLMSLSLISPHTAHAWPTKYASCTSCHAGDPDGVITVALNGKIGTSITVAPGQSFEVDFVGENFTDPVNYLGVGLEVAVPSGWTAQTGGTSNLPNIGIWHPSYDNAAGVGVWWGDSKNPQTNPYDTSGEFGGTATDAVDGRTIDFAGSPWDTGNNRDAAMDNNTTPGLDGVADRMGADAIITVPGGTTPATYEVAVSVAGHDAGKQGGFVLISVTVQANATAPTVVDSNPVDTATGIAVDSSIRISWDENVNCGTVNTTNITIDNGTLGVPTFCSGSQAVFPVTGQTGGTLTTVSIGTGVQDAGGTPMAAADSFQYTTAGGGDTTPPVSAITAPTAGAFLAAGDFPYSITGTASDVGGNVALVEVDINSAGTWPDATDTGGGTWSTWSYSWAQPADGSYTIQSRATDDAGTPNVETPGAGITITVDATAPTDGTLTATPGDSQVDLSWTVATDATSGLASPAYAVARSTVDFASADCAAPLTTTDLTSYSDTGAVNGTTYYYKVCATDNAGNQSTGATASATPAAGNTAPNAPINPAQYESDGTTAVAVGGFSSTTTLVFEGDISDPDGDTVKLQIDYTGDNASDCESALVASGSTNVQVTCAGLTDGTGYDWQYQTVDSNAAASGWTAFNGASPDFTVDATAPTLSSTDPANGATGVTVDQAVTITFNEANLDCGTINTTNITSAMPGWAFSSCNDVTGVAVFTTTGQTDSTTYDFTITSGVADKAGNTFAGPTTISYTTAGPVCSSSDPTVTITSADSQITAGGGNVVYNVDITNNDSVACGDTTFNLSASDTNGGDFAASSLGTTSLLVSPGATQSTTLTVTAVASPTNGATNDTDVTSAAAGPHGAVTSNAVTTLINIPGTPTMYYNIGETVHLEFRTSTRFTNNGTGALRIWMSDGTSIFAGIDMVETQSGGTWIYTYDWDTTAEAADSYTVEISDSDNNPTGITTVVLDNATAQIALFTDANYTNQSNIFADSDVVYVEVRLPAAETAIVGEDVTNWLGSAAWDPTSTVTQTGTIFRANFTVDFLSASVADGDWGWYYWRGQDTNIEFHVPIQRNDAGCGSCTYSTPTVSIVTTDQTINTDGGAANYTINVTNNDTVACGATSFDLVASDTNTTEFAAAGSTFTADPLNVAPGATGSTSMTVTAQAGNFSATNDTFFYTALDVNHAQSANSNTVTTTLSVPDTTPPAVAITAPTNGSYLNVSSADPYTISGTASDDRGVTLVEVSIDGGAFVAATGTGPWTYSWTLPADGTHTIDARATDGANTTNATQVTVTVDTVAPTSSDNILAPWSLTDRSNVTISSVDATSGVANTFYCVDTANGCAPGTVYGGPFTISQVAGQENVQYLRYYSTDTAGNAESPVVSTAVNIDKKSPVDGASLTATPGNNQVSLNWDPATDGGSGLDTTAAYRIWRQTGPTAPACGAGTEIGTGFTATSHVDATAVNGTEYSYRVCAYDLVGNAPSTGLTGTATPAAACVRATPSVALSANQDITSDGGFVDYTVTVTNNDSGGCAAQTFDIKTVTDNGADFTLSYPNGTTTGSIGVGGSDSSLVARVTANAGTLNAATHTAGVSTDGSGDTNHADSAEAQATTTMNVTCTAPTVSIDEAGKTITVNGGSVAYNVSVDWSGGPVACGVRDFNLVPSDTNAVDFVATTFTTDPLSVTPGAAAATTTMVVDSNANVPDLSTNDTYFYTALNSNATLGDVPQSANSAQTVTTTVDRTCVRNAPSFGYGANRTIDVAGSADYTLTVINNDVDCADTTFDITLGTETDTGAPSFTTPSVLSTTTITVAGDNDGAGPGTGGSDTLTLTVTGNGAGSAGDTLTSDVTLSDATNHSGQDVLIQPVTTIQPNNPLIHNSISTESSKWGGSWGVSGGKYGKFECATCHSQNEADLDNGTDFNIKRVRAIITTPDGTNWESTGTPTVSVRFTDANPNPTGAGFGDDSDGHTTSTRVCEACHTQNKYHNYDTALNTLNTHENNNDCTTCHKHNEGFKGGGNCATCHDYPPDPLSGNSELATEGEGAHVKHVSHLVTLLGTGALDPDVDAYGDARTIAVCGACHDMSAAQHETSGGTRNIDFSGDPGTTADDNQYRFAVPDGAPLYKGIQGDPSSTTPKTCSNVSCHYQETPVWQ